MENKKNDSPVQPANSNTSKIVLGAVVILVIAVALLYFGGAKSKTTIVSSVYTTSIASTTQTSTTPTTTMAANQVIIANVITKFTESGLRPTYQFKVTYGGITNMSNVTTTGYNLTLTFSTPPGNYLFTAQKFPLPGSNFTYYPAPASGIMIAGSSKIIVFTKT